MLTFFFSPSGRIGRAKWWLAQLAVICIIASFIVALFVQFAGSGALEKMADASNPTIDRLLALEVLVLALFLTWIGFCITVKRYHDRGKSAWWYLFQFIPIVGPIWAFIELGFCSGDDGDNDYGDGPDFNIADDLKALRKQSEQQEAIVSAPAYRSKPSANFGGPAVFGKRG